MEKHLFTIIKVLDNNKYIIRCNDCNTEKEVYKSYYRKQKSTTCDVCYSNRLVGQVYNRLTVIKIFKDSINSKKRRIMFATCKCVCGIIKNYALASLKNNNTKSCGCLNVENRTLEKKWKYNLNFFDSFSKERNYVIGLLSADGSMSSNLHRCYISLKEEDKSILEKISILIKNTPILLYKPIEVAGQNQYSLYINKKEINEKLVQMGIHSNKTKTYIVPEEFKECPHFWRGFIDGDGYISSNKKNFNMGICGTEDACNSFKEFCNKHGAGLNVNLYKDKNIFRYKIYGKQALQICKILYEDSGFLYIERKYNNYLLKLHETKVD